MMVRERKMVRVQINSVGNITWFTNLNMNNFTDEEAGEIIECLLNNYTEDISDTASHYISSLVQCCAQFITDNFCFDNGLFNYKKMLVIITQLPFHNDYSMQKTYRLINNVETILVQNLEDMDVASEIIREILIDFFVASKPFTFSLADK
jgi:hypothetical protein